MQQKLWVNFLVVILLVFTVMSCEGIQKEQKGGLQLVVQVELESLILDLVGPSLDSSLIKTLAAVKVAQQNSKKDFVTLFGEAYANNSTVPMHMLFMQSVELDDEITALSSNEEVLAVLRKFVDKQQRETVVMLRRRAEKLGLIDAGVALDFASNQITIRLPGEIEAERAKNHLLTVANLEFWELYENIEVADALVGFNTQLKGESVEVNPEEDSSSILEHLDEKVDDLGPLFNLLQLNFPRTSADYSASIGYAEVANMEAIEALLFTDAAKNQLGRIGENIRFIWHNELFKSTTDGKEYVELLAINTKGRKKAALSGDDMTEAFPSPNPSGNGFAIALSMSPKGARIWRDMTTHNVGRQLAMVLDNRVMSAPLVNEPIPNGNTSISGGFETATEAADLANLIVGGKLPCGLLLLEESVWEEE